MTRWFARGTKSPPTKVIEADIRPGGNYRIEVQGDRLYRGFGTYREVKPPERLVFTWNWEHHEFTDAVVTVEFRSLATSDFTEVVLTHDLLPESDREAHNKGWNGCFDSLVRTLRGEEF